MNDILTRRQLLGGISATAVTGLAATAAATGQEAKPAADPFTYCLNTATIRGQTYPSSMRSIWPPRKATRPSSHGLTNWNVMSKEAETSAILRGA